eukprot:PhM_4_TR7801/c0_g1_i1/m.2009
MTEVSADLEGMCVHCFRSLKGTLGVTCEEGPLHNDCIEDYNRTKVERCVHCDCKLKEQRTILNGKKLHPECVADFKAGVKFVPTPVYGEMRKFSIGRSVLGSKNWQTRYFAPEIGVGLYYYPSKQDFEDGKKDPKRLIPIWNQGTRLVTRPDRWIHPEASNPSKEMVVYWHEEDKEMSCLLQAATWQEHDTWVRFFETVIKIVDAPLDLKNSNNK